MSEIAPRVVDSRPGLAREAHVLFAMALVTVAALLFWPDPGEAPPGGTLLDASGEEVELEASLAPVTLVHFWATWCPPCITETPSIRRLSVSLADDPRFALLMVAVADDTEAAVEFLGDGTPTLFDPNWTVTHTFGTEKLPETHLMVGGEVVERFVGAQDWDDPALRQKIEAALARVDRG